MGSCQKPSTTPPPIDWPSLIFMHTDPRSDAKNKSIPLFITPLNWQTFELFPVYPWSRSFQTGLPKTVTNRNVHVISSRGLPIRQDPLLNYHSQSLRMRSRANKYRVLPQPGITNYNSPIIASLSSALIYRMAAWALNFPHSPVLGAPDYYIPGSSHSGNIRNSNQQLHQIHANNRTRSLIVEFSIFGNPNTLDATHNKRRFYPHNNRVCW